MFRRPIFVLSAVLAAVALPVAPAVAGEDDGDDSASLRASSQDCVTGKRAKATVSGDNVDSVAFYVDNKLVKTVNQPASTGRFVFSMRCTRVSVGAHRARAVASFEGGNTQTLRFQITRAVQGSAQFTG